MFFSVRVRATFKIGIDVSQRAGYNESIMDSYGDAIADVNVNVNVLNLNSYNLEEDTTVPNKAANILSDSVTSECEVKWFRVPEAYGFLRIIEESQVNWITQESDIFIHASKLNMVAEVKPGDKLKCKISKGMRGPQVEEVYEYIITDPKTVCPQKSSIEPEDIYIRGTIKWFDAAKGFGFIVPHQSESGLQSDVFLAGSRVNQLGIPLAMLRPHAQVRFTYKIDKDKVVIDKLTLDNSALVKF